MYFMPRVISCALGRQSRRNGMGCMCAKCGEFINPFFKEMDIKGGWYAIPRIPKELGGRGTIDNCVILCPKCYLKIGINNTKEIPRRALPHFEVY